MSYKDLFSSIEEYGKTKEEKEELKRNEVKIMTIRLNRGNRGEQVKKLQRRLAELGFYRGRISGYYGPVTEEAVRRYQQAKGLVVDGWVGAQTWGSLFPQKSAKTQITSVKITVFDRAVGADILRNHEIKDNVERTALTNRILENLKQGSIMLEFGNKDNFKLLINAGIHGNEEESVLATMRYIEDLNTQSEMNSTIYVNPACIPQSIAINSRNHRNVDPNRACHRQGSVGWNVVDFARRNGVDFVFDVHSGGGLERARNGLIIANRNRARERAVVNHLQRRMRTEIAFGPGPVGSTKREMNRAGIDCITFEVERDKGNTKEWSNLLYRMIKECANFLI